MQEQPHPESLITERNYLFVILSILLVFISMVTYNKSSEVDDTYISNLNDTLEKLTHSKIEPCNNTYQYICRNFPNDKQSDEELNEEQLIYLYNDGQFDIAGTVEHHAKRLFQSCDNTGAINKEGWNTVREIVSDLGGWPVISVIANFTWPTYAYEYKDTIYKLRKLGIPPVLFKLSVIPNFNPKKQNWPLHQFSIITNDYFQAGIIGNKMVHLVKLYYSVQPYSNKSYDESKARRAYNRVVQFSEQLQQFKNLTFDQWTVEEYSKETRLPVYYWLKLLNGLSGRDRNVIYNMETQLAFPPPNDFRNFIKIIRSTSTVVVANYIIWTVIYELVPYLHKEVRDAMEVKIQNHTKFCLAEVEKRLELSPISLLADEEYFPPEFRKEIIDYIQGLKDMFKKAVDTSPYIDSRKAKESIKEKISKLQVVVARPEKYYSMNELQKAMGFGLLTPLYQRKDTFLTRILHANKNCDAIMFHKGSQQQALDFGDLDYLKIDYIAYIREFDLLYIPRVVFQRLYDQTLPKYFNLARLGTTILSYFFNTFSEYEEDKPENKYKLFMEDCMSYVIDHYTKSVKEDIRYKYLDPWRKFLAQDFANQFLAGQVARANFEKNNLFINAKYTPEQVFWILMASTFCARGKYADVFLSEMKFFITLGKNTNFTEELLCHCNKENSKIYKFQNSTYEFCKSIN